MSARVVKELVSKQDEAMEESPVRYAVTMRSNRIE
jgi:hypothetical protein